MKSILMALAYILVLVAFLSGAGIGLVYINRVVEESERQQCVSISELYQSGYRYNVKTGCELYIDSPQWIAVD